MPSKKRKPQFRAAIHVPKGAFHNWLGKERDSLIPVAGIAKGKASDDSHVVKMATFAANSKKWH